MDPVTWLSTVLSQFASSRALAERAAAQVKDADFFREPAPECNSVAILMQHMGGNLRSRWTDFLTTDGEKPDRHRDLEFERGERSRAEIEGLWKHGWTACLESISALQPEDLARTVTIRAEPWGVVPAIQRSLSHADYHTGQIVQVARQWAGASWKTLSIPRGQSQQFLDGMRDRFGR